MRFITRSLAGLLLGLVALAFLALAAATVHQALSERAASTRPGPAGQERVFSVNVSGLEPGEVVPVVAAYGEIASTRSLELRAGVGGTLVELAPGFREGGAVRSGETLYQVDPADARAALEIAQIDLAEARAELNEAEAAVELARADRRAAEAQRDLRAQALERQRGLQGRGVGTAPELEAAELALSQAEQTVVGRAQAEAQAEARIARAGIALRRAEINLAEAERRLAATRVEAPFDALLTDVSARPGALVGPNELLGTLIDPGALEVAFRVTGAEFARLLDEVGGLMPLPVTAHLLFEDREVRLEGRIERAGAAVGAGQAGRIVYAALEPDASGLLRPGDFVAVAIEEPPLTDVASLPAAAVSAAQRILVLGDGDRLAEAPVRVLRRQGDSVIVADAPWGAEYVTARAAQLAPGIRVRPIRSREPEIVALDAARRAALIAAVEANPLMPAALRAELIEQLQADRVPQSLIDRVDTGTGG